MRSPSQKTIFIFREYHFQIDFFFNADNASSSSPLNPLQIPSDSKRRRQVRKGDSCAASCSQLCSTAASCAASCVASCAASCAASFAASCAASCVDSAAASGAASCAASLESKWKKAWKNHLEAKTKKDK